MSSPLIAHSLARFRTITLVMSAVLAGFQLLMVVAATTLHESGTFNQLGLLVPPVFRQVFGESLLVFMSFAGIVAFGYFHPMVVAALVGLVIAVATEPAAEVESRFVDAILARPIRRSKVVSRSVVLIVLLPAVILLAMMAASAAGLRFIAPPGVPLPGPRLIASFALNTWALLVSVGGLVLAAAVTARRRAAVAGASALVAFSLFLLDYLARVWEPARSVAWLSPFHYQDAMAMLMGRGLAAGDVATLLASGGVGIAAAYILFSRRDL